MTRISKQNVEGRILESAAALFAEWGYSGTSMRGIAEAADVNDSTLFRHFPHKRDLFLAVLEAELQKVGLRGDLLARIAEARDRKLVLARTFELIEMSLTKRKVFLRLMQYSALDLGPDVYAILRKYLGELVDVVSRYLEPWVVSGAIRATSAKALVLTIIAIILSHHALHELFLQDGSGPEAMFLAYVDSRVLEEVVGNPI